MSVDCPDTQVHRLKRRLKTEQEGFESPLPFGDTVFKTDAWKTNSSEYKDLPEAKTTVYKTAYKENPKQGKNVTSKKSPDLAEIIAIWPQLPSAFRSAIVAIVRTSSAIRGRNIWKHRRHWSDKQIGQFIVGKLKLRHSVALSLRVVFLNLF